MSTFASFQDILKTSELFEYSYNDRSLLFTWNLGHVSLLTSLCSPSLPLSLLSLCLDKVLQHLIH